MGKNHHLETKSTAPVFFARRFFYPAGPIWSYSPGAGAALIRQAADWILREHSEVRDIVTLSPQTEMARKFHLKNGALVHQTNETSVNYRYYHKTPTE